MSDVGRAPIDLSPAGRGFAPSAEEIGRSFGRKRVEMVDQDVGPKLGHRHGRVAEGLATHDRVGALGLLAHVDDGGPGR